jgi:formylglycine-generating enzyme required for sulfatase activity
MISSTLPAGYSLIPAGLYQGTTIASFGFKQTPVTNQEYGEVGRNQFVLLDHNYRTGETRLEKSGQDIEEVMGDRAIFAEGTHFDQGAILGLGVIAAWGWPLLLKMVENPSAHYDEGGRIFSGANQPAVGVTYFHAKAWCLLKSLKCGKEPIYDLPTDDQYEYVASHRGKKEYGTETGTLFKDERKLAHVDEDKDGRGATVAVDDQRYRQRLPFGVQTMGNVLRWTRYNGEFNESERSTRYGPYGLRGGSWRHGPNLGADWRGDFYPDDSSNYIGFSPVVRG